MKCMTLSECYQKETQRLLLFNNDEKAPRGDYLHPVFGDGAVQASLMFIGEAPGAEEAAAGKPFVGKAGKQLSQMLAQAGLVRSDAFVTNAVKYRPVRASARGFSNRTPVRHEIVEGLPLLRAEIELVRPRFIATLGNTPLSAVLQLAEKPVDTVGAVHGVPRQIAIGNVSTVLVPLYHPASGIYNRSLIPVMEQDLVALGLLVRTK